MWFEPTPIVEQSSLRGRYFSGSLAVFEERGEPVKFLRRPRRPERSEGRKSSELI